MADGTSAGKTLVLVGAGFSVPAGQPTTREILQYAQERWAWVADAVPKLERFLSEQPVNLLDQPLARTDFENLVVRVADARGELLHTDRAQWLQSRLTHDKLGTPTAEVSNIEEAWTVLMLIYFMSIGGRYEPDPVYCYERCDPAWQWDQDMPAMYRELFKSLPLGTVIATTNYDDIIERGLVASNRNWSYGCVVCHPPLMSHIEFKPGNGTFYVKWGLKESEHDQLNGDVIWARSDWRPSAASTESDIVLNRLHGSFRWLQCRECSQTYSVDFWAAASYIFDESDEMAFQCWKGCNYILSMAAVLPYLNKQYWGLDDRFLRQQYVSAAKAARKCSHLIIVGSALREGDQGLLRLVRQAARRAKRVTVINPSERDAQRTHELTKLPIGWFRSLESFLESSRIC